VDLQIAGHRDELREVAKQNPVGKHSPLWLSCRPTGVEDTAWIVGIHLRRLELGIPVFEDGLQRLLVVLEAGLAGDDHNVKEAIGVLDRTDGLDC
jgi:hypothetical protein